jgi:hypothetical protein
MTCQFKFEVQFLYADTEQPLFLNYQMYNMVVE